MEIIHWLKILQLRLTAYVMSIVEWPLEPTNRVQLLTGHLLHLLNAAIGLVYIIEILIRVLSLVRTNALVRGRLHQSY